MPALYPITTLGLDPKAPVLTLLDHFGPTSAPTPAVPTHAAVLYARALTRRHPENFTVLSLLVPRRLRDDVAAIYAFCRWADDLGDETGNDAHARQRSTTLLDWWQHELDLCYAGRPKHPVMLALAQTINRHNLPQQPFTDLIDAFKQDQKHTHYQTWDELLDYCAKSANPVGQLVLMLDGYTPATHPDLFTLSDAACTALQITNHLQDCQRDLLQRGRVYLPITITRLDEPTLRHMLANDTAAARQRFANAIAPLWDQTQALYNTAAPLPKRLNRSLWPMVWLMVQGGQQTHAEIKSQGLTTLWHRPRLNKARKGLLVLRAAALALTHNLAQKPVRA